MIFELSPSVLLAGAILTSATAAAVLCYLLASAAPPGEEIAGRGERERDVGNPLMTIALRFARMLAPLHAGASGTGQGQQLERKLVRAGRPFGMTLAELLALRWLGLVIGFLLGYVLSLQAVGGFSLPIVAAISAFGFFYGPLRLNQAVERRRIKIFRDLPAVLDLLTLSTEAGQDFSSAMTLVVEKGPEGPLIDEFRVANQEISLGKSRADALRGIAARVDLPELSSFVLSLLQAEQLGTSTSQALRIMAEQMRVKRFTIGEEMAGKVPVKLMAPLVLLIFPASFIVLFVPLYIRAQALSGF